MKTFAYNTTGTCSKQIVITIDDDETIKEVRFLGGCPGNTIGISSLVCGMKASEVVTRLKGTQCGFKSTSCPDQLAQALTQICNQVKMEI